MTRKLQVYDTATVTVTFDPQRCIHFAHCVRSLPAVFNPGARPWVQPAKADAEAVLRAVAGCPTGALRAKTVDGASADAPLNGASLSVRVSPDGPLFLRGAVTVVDGEDSTLVEDDRIALCRCGLSQRKPLCDGSHRAAGWRDSAPMADSQP